VLLMGDTHCFVAGGWDKSVLAPLLPVTLRDDDRVHPERPLALTPRQDWIRGLHLDWGAAPYTVYYHQATVKPDAQVLAGAGAVPLVVQGKVGRGRIVVFLNSVLGEKVAGAPGVPFWEWADWPKFMAAVLAGEGEFE
jgi:uncharacterized membrane protein